jgi:signal transduction histidine kinase
LLEHKNHSAIGAPVTSVVRDERILSLIQAWSVPHEEPSEQRISYMHFSRGEKQYYFRPRLSRIFTPEGELYAVVTLLQDVTQFKELDRMKSDFIATLSHEFRTPITSINMSIDILNQEIAGPLNAKQRELIGATKEDCFRLTKLARELLQLSKLESGRLQLKNEELTIHSVIDFSLRPLQLQFQEKNVRLVTDIAPDIPRLVADEQQISWVITNLVTNALKYTDAGGTVTIRAREEAEGLLLEVEDTGQGISEEHLERIFDKFVQVRKTSYSTPGSVGLGLAIAKEIVEMYGGRIWARSRPGKGSTFSFMLPLSKIHSRTA